MRPNALLFCLLLTASAVAGTIHGKVTVPGQAHPTESAVYIEKIPGKSFPAPAQHFTISQKWLMFQPPVLVIPAGSTVDFKNEDVEGHNVNWTSIGGNKALAHNLGDWEPGQARSWTFKQTGIVPLLCRLHATMKSYLIVSPTPYFAVTDKSGNYTIQNVPAGTYRLVAWHEGKKQVVKTIHVGSNTVADFLLAR